LAPPIAITDQVSAQRQALETLLRLQTDLEAARDAEPCREQARRLQGRIAEQLEAALRVARGLEEQYTSAATDLRVPPPPTTLHVLDVSGEEVLSLPRTTAPTKILDLERAVAEIFGLSGYQRLDFVADGAVLESWVDPDVEFVTAVLVQAPQVEVFTTPTGSVNKIWILPVDHTDSALGMCGPQSDANCAGLPVGEIIVSPKSGSRRNRRGDYKGECTAVLASKEDLELDDPSKGFPDRLARREHICKLVSKYRGSTVFLSEISSTLAEVAGAEVPENVVAMYTAHLAALGVQ